VNAAVAVTQRGSVQEIVLRSKFQRSLFVNITVINRGLGVDVVHKACCTFLAGENVSNPWEVDVIEQKTHEKPKISNKTVEQNLGQILFDSFVKIEKQN
jgi:hypothetical protein